jgi:thymidylate synthase
MNNQFVLSASSINDAWFQTLYQILAIDENGKFKHAYPTGIIQSGSFEGEQSRLQFPGFSLCIENPQLDRLVRIPEGSNVPAPVAEDEAEEYFYHYIFGHELAENETYTYGSRLNVSLYQVMEMLNKTPITNQAVIEIAQPDDTFKCVGKDGKLDPPCARLVDFKVIPIYDEGGSLNKSKSKLDMHLYFRSWDLYGGMPANLYGFSRLQETVSEYIGIPVGKLYAYSSGLHLYKYQKELAEMRTKLTSKDY